jgi:hypothetical protein
MAGCGCENGASAASPAASRLQQAFESFWPSTMPFPYLAPWMAGMISRDRAASLAVSSGTRTLTAQQIQSRKAAASDDYERMAVDGADTDCRECPERTCFIGYVLPEMAADWYAEGGFARDIVVMLYDMLGQEFCTSGECEASSTKLTNCRYECMDISYVVYHDEEQGEYRWGWMVEFFCCCDEREERPFPGPGPGGFFPPEIDIPDYQDNDGGLAP